MVRSVVSDILVLKRTGRTGILVLLVRMLTTCEGTSPNRTATFLTLGDTLVFTPRLTNTLVPK